MRRPTPNSWLLVAGILAVALLVVPAALLARNLARSHALDQEIHNARQQLKALGAQRPFPSGTNTAVLRAATRHAGELLAKARAPFQPLPTIKLTEREFQNDLEARLAALREQARAAGLRLPTKNYSFTFAHQRLPTSPTAEAAAARSQALAQVEWLCAAVFHSHCDLLELRRPRLPGEPAALRAEFTYRWTATNTIAHAVLAPYRIVVEGSTADLAELLGRCGNAPHGVIARVLSVERGEQMLSSNRPVGSPTKGRPVTRHPHSENSLRVTLQLDFVTALD